MTSRPPCPASFIYNGLKKTAVQFISALLVIFFTVGITSCGFPPGSESSATTSASQADPLLSDLAGGGNLHYQNLVLPVNTSIYFNASDGQLSWSGIDGSARLVLFSQPGRYLASDGTYLFYTTENQNLAKIKLDGTGQVRIGKIPLKYLICSEDWLYAIEADQNIAIRVKKDGTGREVLSDQEAIALTLSEGKLYISGPDEETGLRVFDPGTGESKKILARQTASLNISGSWLYYAVPSDNYSLHAWNLADPADRIIGHFNVEKPFVVRGGKLYFISSEQQSRLYGLPVSGGKGLDNIEPELIVDDLVDAFAVVGDWIYYQRPVSSRIYRVSILDRQIVRIT